MSKLEPDVTAALDKLFNSWLAFNNMLSHEGFLYQADETGKKLNDAQGNPLKVNPEEFKALMADPKKGFKSYAAQKGLRVTPVAHDFPS